MSNRTLKRKRVPRSELAPEGPSYMARDEALAALAIKASTLYTYVSRGLIRSIPIEGSRQRQFSRVDVEELVGRSKAHEGGAARAQSVMRFGEPIISTSITNVTSEGPVYRGHSAVELARAGVSFEAVTHLLWRGTLDDELAWPTIARSPLPIALVAALELPLPPQDVLKLFSLIILALGLPSAGLQENQSGSATASAQEIINTLACCTGFLSHASTVPDIITSDGVAMTIGKALGATERVGAARLINAAMILCADMELTPGTFAARIAASVGSDVYACLAAGMSAHDGGRGGRDTNRCEEFLLDKEQTVEQKLAHARQQGQRLPGFYYRIFPEGDPRARALIDLVKETIPLTAQAVDTLYLIERVETECENNAGIAAALVLMSAALGLPRHSAAAIWAIGRIAGQVAHIVEQRNEGFMLRPRARYDASRSSSDDDLAH